MDRQFLRDKHSLIIGWREDCGDRITGYDANGRIRGWYTRADDRTRDSNGMWVGSGDLLSSLITSIL